MHVLYEHPYHSLTTSKSHHCMRDIILTFSRFSASRSCHVKVITMNSSYVPDTNDVNGKDGVVGVSSDELRLKLAEDESAALMKARPHLCSHDGCGKRFSKANALMIHERVHTGDKLFKCSHKGCGKSVSPAGHLKDHERIHTGEKPFMCSYKGCGYRSTRSSNVTQHCKSMHKDDTSAGWIKVPASTSLPSPPASASSPATAPISRKRKRVTSAVTPTSSSASPSERNSKARKVEEGEKKSESEPVRVEAPLLLKVIPSHPTTSSAAHFIDFITAGTYFEV